MKLRCRLWIPLVLLANLLPAVAQAASNPAGHWAGAITLPGTALAIRVDLEQSTSGWSGTIDIPVQGLRGFQLGDVTVKDRAVAFAMPGIPGDPKFAGTLAADGNAISGTFTQGGQRFPFKLERQTTKPADAFGETPAKGVPGQGLAGHWQGSLKPSPLVELRLVLELTNNAPAGRLGGVIVSVDQGHARIPLTTLTEQAGEVRFEARSVGGVFDGRLSADGSEIVGQWQQGGGKTPLSFKRLAKAPQLNRPQEPKKPYPYEEEEVTIPNSATGVTLAGTFTKPRGAGPHPAVMLLSGSGPQDRDEAIMGHRPFLVLADHLTRQGIAVLRCDDRGVGKSTGDFGAATHEDFVADTLAGVAWLKRRAEIDSKRIGLIGHSEGGLIAPLAAVRQPEDIAFIVLLAGVGVPTEELLVRQGQDLARAMGAAGHTLERNAKTQRESFRILRQDLPRSEAEQKLRELLQAHSSELTEAQRQALGYTEAMLDAQVQTVLTPWFRNLLTYDPRPTLRQVKCPVLALNGEKDLQVSAKENLAAIREALIAGGNRQVQTREFPGLNHLFQTCTTGAVSEYGQIEETFNPAALDAISDWVRTQAGLR